MNRTLLCCFIWLFIFYSDIQAQNAPCIITCPDDVLLSCTDNFSQEILANNDLDNPFGHAYVVGDCEEYDYSVVVFYQTINGRQAFTRNFTAINGLGNELTCRQILYVDELVSCLPDTTYSCARDISIEILNNNDSDNPYGYIDVEDCPNVTIQVEVDLVPISNIPIYRREFTVLAGGFFVERCYQLISFNNIISCPNDSTYDCLSDISIDILSNNNPDNPYGYVIADTSCNNQVAVTARELSNSDYYREFRIVNEFGQGSVCRQFIRAEEFLFCPSDTTANCSDISLEILNNNNIDNPFGFAAGNPICNVEINEVIVNSNFNGSTRSYIRQFLGEDIDGNSSECIQTITTNSFMVCPTDTTVNCSDLDLDIINNLDPNNPYGNVDILPGACAHYLSVTVSDLICGSTGSYYKRTFTASDALGPLEECSQRIYVDSGESFTICDTESRCTPVNDDYEAVCTNGGHTDQDNIEWPCDLTLDGCDLGSTPSQLNDRAESDLDINGVPIRLNAYPRYANLGDLDGEIIGDVQSNCNNLIFSFGSNFIFNETDSCVDIRRLWVVRDLCQFDGITMNPNNPNQFLGHWTYWQTIKILNYTSQTIAVPVQTDFCDLSGQPGPNVLNCLVDVELSSGIIPQEPTTILNQTWFVDYFSNGTIDDAGQDIFLGPVPQTHPDGLANAGQEHTIYWIVTDECGISTRTQTMFTAIECKKPVPYCRSNIEPITLTSSGCVTILPTDLNAGSFDNCTPSDELIFSVGVVGFTGTGSADQPGAEVTICCDDIAAMGSSTFMVKLFVVDRVGNMDNCQTPIEIIGLPEITFNVSPESICIDAGIQSNLGGATPAGGMYSGVGVIDDGNGITYSFDPTSAGLGNHTITYMYGDENGCYNVASDDIQVFDLPTVSFATDSFYCADAPIQSVMLAGGSPTGGVYSGVGVTDNGMGTGYFLDPSIHGAGVLTITYTLTDENMCTQSASSDIELANCDFNIADPCNCLNNASIKDLDTMTGGNDGQFSEVISITNGNGGTLPQDQIWTITMATGAYDAYNVPMMGVQSSGVPIATDSSVIMAYISISGSYEIPFVHNDGIGYSIEIEGPFIVGDPSNSTFTISNNCTYPDPIFNPILLDEYCQSEVPIHLDAIDINGYLADNVSFLVNGTLATNLDISEPGMFTVLMTFDGTDDGNNGISPDEGMTPASPGCIQTVQKIVNVITSNAIISCPADTTIDCGTPITELGTATAMDDCGNEYTIVFNDSTVVGNCPIIDTIFRTWTGTDPMMNSISCLQKIMVQDTIPPLITCPSDFQTSCIDTLGEISSIPDFINVGGTIQDNCRDELLDFSISSVDVSNGMACPETITRRYEISDDCGNIQSCVQTITIIDSFPPNFIDPIPLDTVIACSSMLPVPPMIAASDDCNTSGNTIDVVFIESKLPGACTSQDTILRLWVAEDVCGNTVQDSQYILLIDTLIPIFIAPMDTLIDCEVYATDSTATGTVTEVMDACGESNISYTDLVDLSGCGGYSGVVTRTWTVGDDCDNDTSFIQIITVQDTTPPTFTVPMNIEISCTDNPLDTLITGEINDAVDNCSEAIMVTFTDTGILNPVSGTGTLTRTWVAEDACGNTSSQDQMITISDNLAPTFICLGKITRFLEGGACNIIVDYNIVATDNCDDNPTITQTDLSGFTSGDSFPEGIYTQTYQAEDVNGNISICSFEIEIIQVEPTDLSLTCEGSIINVSIDQDCQVIIQPDVLLVGDDHGCYGTRYQVNIDLNRDGVFDDGNVADISHVGQVFDAQVEDTETGNMCWSQLRFEDKIDPIVNCGCEGYEPIDENAMTLIGVFNGHTYYTSTGNFTWQDAQAQAESMSGHLVSINSPEENMFIQEFISTMSGRSWIGLTDNEAFGGTEADTDPVEGWVWTSGEPVTFTNWSTGEPNNLGNEDFAEMFENGQWNDLPNSGPGNTIPFILEIDGVCEFECDEDLVDVAAPEVIDCGIESMTYTDAEEDLACVTGFERIINRTWTIVDLGGNEASCTQRIFVRVTGLEDFDFPENMDGIVNPALECNGNWVSISNPDYPGLRIPSPASTGEPSGISCGNVQFTYWDHVIPICDLGTDNPAYWGTYKVVRHWIISDWCTGEVEEMNQLIKVEDTTAPTVTCPDDVTVGVTGHDCDRDLMRLPYPTVIDECGHATATPSVVTSEGGVILPGAFLYQQGADWFVRDLTIGDNVITWTANDGCGNEGECDYTITVEDQTPPVPVCESYRQVSVTSDGYAKIFAESFDDGSNDNCGPVWFKVVREVIGACGQINGDDSVIPGYQEWPDDYVKFCCADIGEPVRVRLRVYDVDPGAGPIAPGAFAGRWNECWSEVTVEDKLPPAISCPPDMTVSCDNDILISDLDNNDAGNQYGTAVAFDNCDAVITVRANEPTDCGTGSRFFTRTFTATDPDGRIARCTQRIFLEESPFKICDTEARCTQLGNSCDSPHSRRDNVEWPCDLVLEECGLGLDPWQLNANAANVRDANGQRVALNAYPRYDNAGELNGQILGVYPYACAQIAIDSADQVFTLVEDACLKILRTWTVIDWCQFDAVTRDPDDPNRFLGYWEYIQVIKVRNTVGPTFAEVGNTDFCDESTPDCLVSVSLTSGATDDCTPSDHLHYAWAVDAFSDGSFDLAGSGPTFSGRVPQAFGNQNHTIRWTVEDGCGNTSVTEYTFTAKECKKPTPYCDNGIAIVVMPSSGSVAVWASDLDAGSFDNCTEQENLEFGIRKIVDGNPVGSIQPSLTLDCDCMPNGVSETISVEIWVTDEAGNTDNCVTYILLQDTPDENNPEGVCPDNNPVPLVGGGIATEEGISAQAHEVQLVGADNQVIETDFTDINGEYAFVTLGGEAVRPVNNLDPALGLSTLDLIAVQRHVLGIELFESPYKMIAADVTNDGAINVLDLLEEQQVILGLRSEFANNQSWVYVAADEVMDINNPYSYESPKSIPIYTQNDNIVQDFVAIKIGDVNATALNGAGTILERSGLVLEIADEKVVYGEETLESEIRVPVTSSNFTSIDGYQFTLDYDQSNLEFVSIESGALNIRPENVGVHTTGKVATNWYDETAQTVEAGEVLFTLVFRGESIESLVINSDVTSAESYRNGQIQSVRLAFNGATAEAFALRQNEPNPFSAQTKIMFDLPSATTATLTVFDVTGKTLMSRNIDGAAGYNETVITKSDVNATGVLYYRVDTEDYTATKKMISIQ